MAGIILLFIVVWIVFGAIFFFGVLKPETTDQFKSKTRLYLAILIGGPVVFFGLWLLVLKQY